MIVFEIIPKPKVRMVKSDCWKKRPVVLKYWQYKDELVKQAKENNYTIPEILENITFVMPIPKSYSQKKRQSLEGNPHTLRPDLDNLVKAWLDCLLPKNDSQVHTFNNIRKIWGETGKVVIG